MKINKKNLKKSITKSLIENAVSDYLFREFEPCKSLYLFITEDDELKLCFSSFRDVIFRPENIKYQVQLMSDCEDSNDTIRTFFAKNEFAVITAIEKAII